MWPFSLAIWKGQGFKIIILRPVHDPVSCQEALSEQGGHQNSPGYHRHSKFNGLTVLYVSFVKEWNISTWTMLICLFEAFLLFQLLLINMFLVRYHSNTSKATVRGKKDSMEDPNAFFTLWLDFGDTFLIISFKFIFFFLVYLETLSCCFSHSSVITWKKTHGGLVPKTPWISFYHVSVWAQRKWQKISAIF